jgi:hypothetical protein
MRAQRSGGPCRALQYTRRADPSGRGVPLRGARARVEASASQSQASSASALLCCPAFRPACRQCWRCPTAGSGSARNREAPILPVRA